MMASFVNTYDPGQYSEHNNFKWLKIIVLYTIGFIPHSHVAIGEAEISFLLRKVTFQFSVSKHVP
jgi:hypothetical protein